MSYERKTPKVSIIVPSWFHEKQHGKYGLHETFTFAHLCLNQLYRSTEREDFELIIIDNGSTLEDFYLDGRQEPNQEKIAFIEHGDMFVRDYWACADVLIKNRENLGFGPACNQGFAVARGEYVCCLNNDVLMWPGWLDALLKGFELEMNPKVGVVMPALIPNLRSAHEALELENPDFTWHAGEWGAHAEFGSLWIAPRALLKEVADTRDGYQVFDENFKLGMGEDRWLWQQIRHLGYETYRCHDTRVFHQGNLTIGKVKDRKDYTSKNREYLAELKEKYENQ